MYAAWRELLREKNVLDSSVHMYCYMKNQDQVLDLDQVNFVLFLGKENMCMTQDG